MWSSPHSGVFRGTGLLNLPPFGHDTSACWLQAGILSGLHRSKHYRQPCHCGREKVARFCTMCLEPIQNAALELMGANTRGKNCMTHGIKGSLLCITDSDCSIPASTSVANSDLCSILTKLLIWLILSITDSNCRIPASTSVANRKKRGPPTL